MYAKDIMAKYGAPLHASMPHISYARKICRIYAAYEAYILHICAAYFAKFRIFCLKKFRIF